MTDREHYSWSRDAEANDTIDMGSDHRCVMAKFVIPVKTKKKARNNESTQEGKDDNTEDGEQSRQMNEN